MTFNSFQGKALAFLTVFWAAAPPLMAEEEPKIGAGKPALEKLLADIELAKTKKAALQEINDLQKEILAFRDAQIQSREKELTKIDQKIEAEKKRKLPKGTISILEAKIMLKSDETLQCNARGFANYHCAGYQECDFEIIRAVCPLVAVRNDPLELRVRYQCGADEPRFDEFLIGFVPSKTAGKTEDGTRAFLTCF